MVFKFINLHLHKGRKAAKLALKGLSGIYAIIHIPSGRVYIGSSINLARRLAEHLGYGSTLLLFDFKPPFLSMFLRIFNFGNGSKIKKIKRNQRKQTKPINSS